MQSSKNNPSVYSRCLWWFIDSNSAILLCFRSSEVPWKLKTKETEEEMLQKGTRFCLVYKKTSFLLSAMINKRGKEAKIKRGKSKMFKENLLCAFFTNQRQKKNRVAHQPLMPQPWETTCHQQYLKCHGGPPVATFQRWQPHY